MNNTSLIKKVSAASLAIASYITVATPAFAQSKVDPCPNGTITGGTNFNNLCKLDSSKIGQIIATVVTVLLIAATIIALFFLILGGIRWITSGGDKGKVESARNTIIAAIIGLIIAFLAYFILTVVLGFFGLSLSNLQLPKLF